jgi:hypothetical protein
MTLPQILVSVAFWLVAAATGVILVFAAVIAPTVFRTLTPEDARHVMRALFPRYHAVLIIGVTLAAGLAGLAGRVEAGLVLGVIAASFVWARTSLTPRVNLLKDRALAGDETAEADFDRAHRMSVSLNLMQLLALVAVAYGLVRG